MHLKLPNNLLWKEKYENLQGKVVRKNNYVADFEIQTLSFYPEMESFLDRTARKDRRSVAWQSKYFMPHSPLPFSGNAQYERASSRPHMHSQSEPMDSSSESTLCSSDSVLYREEINKEIEEKKTLNQVSARLHPLRMKKKQSDSEGLIVMFCSPAVSLFVLQALNAM